MPKVKRSRKPPPDGWELIEPTLDELDQKMREAETEPHEGKRKVESLWPIFRIHHQKTRYIFDLFYKRKAISRELYEYCIKEGYADKNLIAKWKKQGYENLCCLRCIQTRDTNFGTNCICRVPKSKLEVVSVQLVPLLCNSCSDFSQLSRVVFFLLISSAFAGRIGVQLVPKLLSALAFI
uniref:Protein BUD31 homolog n=1 Tax=Cyanistes caeruleus TaxID=156563 RepID=A0A8C0VKW5_CYACU